MTTTPRRLEGGSELDDFIASHDVALVEFYTSGCTLCQAMEPVLGNVARATAVDIGMINPGNDIELVDRFDIRSVPTLILFEDGSEIARLAEGFQGGDAVTDFLATHVPTAVGSS
ncbi:thioredoxin family protein [Natrinema ejinorense]|uniref:Thiol reductase thioredoxin n=1 Tax=Natrinema ejinorense TaxID=373386 RepID=A0A2A5QVU6_9EURY|nr:thioredoxin family protein [Natrinema ejinorense]PCR90950.1 thiol reductase thioredoxin [Natrinema ejinorense]